MRIPENGATTRVVIQNSREEVVAMVESRVPLAIAPAEDFAQYAMVAAFWGVVFYMALTFGLQ